MFSWQLDDELALLFQQPDMASEQAVSPLSAPAAITSFQWLPWVPHIQQPADSAPPSFATPSMKFAGEGLTTAIESGEVVGVISCHNQIDQDLGKVTIGYWLAERWQGARHHHPGPARPDPITPSEEMGMEKVEDQRRPREREAEPGRVRAAGNDPGGDHPAGRSG